MSKSLLSAVGATYPISTFRPYINMHGARDSVQYNYMTYLKASSCSISAFKVRVDSNTRTVTVTFTVSTFTNSLISFATLETGLKENLDFTETFQTSAGMWIDANPGSGSGAAFADVTSLETNSDSSCLSPFTSVGGYMSFGTSGGSIGSSYGTHGCRCGESFSTDQGWNSTYSRSAIEIYSNYTTSNFVTHVISNTMDDVTLEYAILFDILKNGAATDQSITYGWYETGVKEDTSTVSFTSGDDIVFRRYYRDADADSVTCMSMTTYLENTENKRFLCISSMPDGNSIGVSSTIDFAVQGMLANYDRPISTNFDMTFTRLYSYVPTNTNTGNSTVSLEEDTVVTSLQITYTSGQTGLKTDTDSVYIEQGHTINYSSTAGATGTSFVLTTVAGEVNTSFHWKPQTIFVNYG